MRTAPAHTRVELHPGSRVTARDLRDAMAAARRRRELHVRAMHDSWGVALGFDVHIADDGLAVLVKPGLAYDGRGREIVSSRTLRMSPPAPPAGDTDTWWFDLLASFDELPHAASHTCDAGCDPTSHPREERPALRWSLAGESRFAGDVSLAADVRLGLEIPLARVTVAADGRCRDVSSGIRRHTQPLARPHIARGRMLEGAVPITGSMWAWSVTVVTETAGFTSVPSYFVSLGGDPLDERSGFHSLLPADRAALRASLLGPCVSIHDASSASFVLAVRYIAPSQAVLDAAPAVMRREFELPLPVEIAWMGLEHEAAP